MDAVRRHLALSMELVMCMVCAMAFGLASIAPEFATLFYGDDFTESGTLMIPLAFTLLTIGFANVIRTQWVLPQKRDHIFVRSVLTGAVINLIANAILIPMFGAMGAVAATVMAELSVPVVQYIYLHKELPYGAYLRATAVYVLFGLLTLLCVRACAAFMPLNGWVGLSVRVMVGAIVYCGLCLVLWHAAKRQDILHLLHRK